MAALARSDTAVGNSIFFIFYDMLYGQMFQSSFTSFEDFLYGDAKRDTFVLGYDCLVEKYLEYEQKEKI